MKSWSKDEFLVRQNFSPPRRKRILPRMKFCGIRKLGKGTAIWKSRLQPQRNHRAIRRAGRDFQIAVPFRLLRRHGDSSGSRNRASPATKPTNREIFLMRRESKWHYRRRFLLAITDILEKQPDEIWPDVSRIFPMDIPSRETYPKPCSTS